MTATWTADELRRFDLTTMRLGSVDQLERIEARINIDKLVQEWGKEKCDAMFAHLQKEDRKRK